jgi:hypothetical protein
VINVLTINERVDGALARNTRAEIIVIAMATAIFLVGVSIVIVAYWLKNPYVSAGGAFSQFFLRYPIREILKVRRDNLILETFPAMVSSLPPEKAAVEISKTLRYLLSR